jgi:hypothetical protein
MAKKKKTTEKIYVKNPKVGESYYFRFAGCVRYGELLGINKNLTNAQKKYFKLIDKEGIIYPVNHSHISKNPKNIEYV